MQLDTGSFELWVNPDCSTVTGGDAAFCERAGQYDTTKSSTAKALGTTRTLRYGIGSANISYFTDTITLAGSTTALRDVQFGVATWTEDAFSGILGIGYGKGIGTRYPNFVDQLHAQGAVRVKAYTLALGSKDAQEGVVVFGGVDTSKFAGPLARLPIIPAARAPDRVPRFWIDLRSVSLGAPPNGSAAAAAGWRRRAYEGSAMPVFLDSGSTMTLLPPALAGAIARDFGAEAPDANGFYRIDCALAALGGTLDFAFDGVTVRVPFRELTREVASDPPACFLGIMPSERFTLLGDTFLRSAYGAYYTQTHRLLGFLMSANNRGVPPLPKTAVFDLETDSIWMTQAENCGSTPAALRDVRDLAAVTGACGLTSAAVPGTGRGTGTSSSSNSIFPGGGETEGQFGTAAIPGGGRTDASSRTGSTGSSATSSGGTGSSAWATATNGGQNNNSNNSNNPEPASPASRCARNTLGLVWGFWGVAVVLQLLASST